MDRFAQVWSTGGAFLVRLRNGQVSAWGDKACGGELPDATKQALERGAIEQVWSTFFAFLVHLKDGRVFTWGDKAYGGEMPDATKRALERGGVEQVWSTRGAFLVKLKNGQVFTWGDRAFGGELPDATKRALERGGVEQVWSTNGAFLARLTNGQVLTWGSKSHGGELPEATKRTLERGGIQEAWATCFSFMAHLTNGQVFTWGNKTHGGQLPDFTKRELERGGIEQVWTTDGAFLVRLKDKQVYAWGCNRHGGNLADATKLALQQGGIEQAWSAGDYCFVHFGNGQVSVLGGTVPHSTTWGVELGGLQQVWTTKSAILVRFKNGQVFAYGNKSYGGEMPYATKRALERGVIEQVWSTELAFLVRLRNRQVHAWGHKMYGGELPAATRWELEQAAAPEAIAELILLGNKELKTKALQLNISDAEITYALEEENPKEAMAYLIVKESAKLEREQADVQRLSKRELKVKAISLGMDTDEADAMLLREDARETLIRWISETIDPAKKVEQPIVDLGTPKAQFACIVVFDGLPVTTTQDRSSAEVAQLSKGTSITVLEVASEPKDGRVRARIAFPSGWISTNMADGSYQFVQGLEVSAVHVVESSTTLSALLPGRMVMQPGEVSEISIVAYTAWKDLVPTRTCVQELRENALIRAKCSRIDAIAHDVELKVQELRFDDDVKHLTHLLDDDELSGIVSYTHDLNQPNDVKSGNLYFEENVDLRKRDTQSRVAMMKTWGTHVHYTLRGLGKLENFEGVVYRGTPDKASVLKNYNMGRPIQWGAFTSTTTLLDTAKAFTGTAGVIFRIQILTGKNIGLLSFFRTEEEIILSPNHRLVVAQPAHDEDGYCFVDLIEQRGDPYKS